MLSHAIFPVTAISLPSIGNVTGDQIILPSTVTRLVRRSLGAAKKSICQCSAPHRDGEPIVLRCAVGQHSVSRVLLRLRPCICGSRTHPGPSAEHLRTGEDAP